MLVFTRKAGESITIDNNVTITILEAGKKVRVGIDAPRSIEVHRLEVRQRIVKSDTGKAPPHEPNTMAVVE